MIEQFKQARRVGVPLVAIKTVDPAQTVLGILEMHSNVAIPVIEWDMTRGPVPRTKAGSETLELLTRNMMLEALINPVEMLNTAQRLPGINQRDKVYGSILFMHGTQYLIENPAFCQAVWNLRDPFKSNGRTLVLLCPDITLPPSLAQDVLVLDEPLPTKEEMASIAESVFTSAGVEATKDEIAAAVENCMGLAAYCAEQTMALSLERDPETKKLRINKSVLASKRRESIESTPGLSIYEGKNDFSKVGGCESIKGFIKRLTSRKHYAAVVFLDEIEKMLAGAAGSGQDSSGVSQGILGKLLSYMQDNEVDGILELGVPGSGKTEIAKCTGAHIGVPTISMNLGDMKASYVGQTEARLRQALKVISTVSQGSVLFIGTCNNIGSLPSELLRRFNLGTYFFDLPEKAEREAIWDIYFGKYGVSGELPDDDNWTGAEIKTCCRLSALLDTPLRDSAKYIVPTATTMGEGLSSLRKLAHGRFLSASRPEVYSMDRREAATVKKATRRVNFAQEL